MQVFVDHELLELGRVAAAQLVASAEKERAFRGPGQTEVWFLVRRTLGRGYFPIASLEHQGETFYITGRPDRHRRSEERHPEEALRGDRDR